MKIELHKNSSKARRQKRKNMLKVEQNKQTNVFLKYYSRLEIMN